MIELGTTGNPTQYTCLVYNYYADEGNPTSCAMPSQGTKNNGNVMGYWYQDSVQPWSHTSTYNYDGVNRLISACTLSGSQCATSGSNVYNLAFGYDRFGNMDCTGGVGGGSAIGPCPAWAYNTSTNQLSSSTGCTYDAAGNMTTDCSSPVPHHTYQWDAEGRVTSVDNGSTWTFTYDALGDRVQMTGPSGSQYLAYDVAGNWIMVFGVYGNYDVVRWGERMFSIYTSTGTEFNHVNNLSSTSIYTNQAGTAVEDMLFYPWGLVWESWGTGGYNYAGIPYRDPSTTTDLSAFRVLSPGLGRWLSPDPVGGDITNPQSLNRYPYVLNNPTSLTDPLGLQMRGCPPGTRQMGYGQCGGPPRRPYPGPWWDLLALLTQTLCNAEGCWTQPWPGGMALANLLATLQGGSGNSSAFMQRPAKKPCKTGFGLGVQVGADAAAGAGFAGAAATRSAGAGLFFGGSPAVGVGAYGSGGAAAYAGSRVAANPAQSSVPTVVGGGAGVSIGGFITNASSASQLRGPFLTFGGGASYGAVGVGVQVSVGKDAAGNDIWQLSLGYAPGFLAYGYGLTTNTSAVATGALCQ